MRIIAGQYRGRELKTLKGSNTRPTTDRVREALMSSLYSARGGFEGACVLDAFAGSGALGLECLSRGASYCVFCEQDRDAERIISQNIVALRVPKENFRLRKGDAFTLPQASLPTFDLLFFDPPYAYDACDIAHLITSLDEVGCIAEGALICYEYAKKDASSVFQAMDALKYVQVSVKNYGDTSLITLRKEQK